LWLIQCIGRPCDRQLQRNGVIMETPDHPSKPVFRAPAGAGDAATVVGTKPTTRLSSQSQHINALIDAAQAREDAVTQRVDGSGHVPANILEALLGMMTTPTLLLDQRLQIVFANATATATLASGLVMSSQDGRLLVDGEDQITFAKFVTAACRGCPQKRTLVLGGTKPNATVVWLRPLPPRLQSSAMVWHDGLVALSFRPLRRRQNISRLVLKDHFRLTKKQIEVVVHLSGGKSLEDVAIAMSISLATVRSHLSQCYAKTGVHRLPDLVSLALSLTSPVFD
jgi:DNA-binding CsgD family transcriptional regulator